MILNTKQLFECTGFKESFAYLIDTNSYLEESGAEVCFPLSVTGEARNCAGVVTLEAKVSFQLDTCCDRCLRPIKLNQDVFVEHTLVRSLSTEDDASDEYMIVDTDQLDLDDLFAGEVLLALPSKRLCKEDCKGLCQVCGHDLNEGECGCDRRVIDPRLEVLRNLLKED